MHPHVPPCSFAAVTLLPFHGESALKSCCCTHRYAQLGPLSVGSLGQLNFWFAYGSCEVVCGVSLLEFRLASCRNAELVSFSGAGDPS